MFKRWNGFCILGLAVLLAGMLAACGDAGGGKDGVLPFTSIVPGMSIEEIRKLEPELAEDGDGYYLTKDYNGFPMEAFLSPEKLNSIISWRCDDDALDLDKLADRLTDYFNKKYEVDMAVDEDDYTMIAWRTETYDIVLVDSSSEFMGIASRDITLHLSVRLDKK